MDESRREQRLRIYPVVILTLAAAVMVLLGRVL